MLWVTKKYYLIECLRPLGLSIIAGLVVWLSVRDMADWFFISSLVISIAPFAWLVLRFADVVRVFWYQRKCHDKVESDQARKGIVIMEGGNRTGKSLDGFATLFNKSQALEQYVNRFTLLYRAKKTKEKLTEKEHREYREINETYKFYKKHPQHLTSLVTNVKVISKSDGRESMELLGGHLIQTEKLPRPCALGLDESRDKVNNDIYKDQDGVHPLINFARLFNQYTGDNSLFVLMEQNSARAFHGYRDSVCVIKNMKGIKVLLEPVRLFKRLEKRYRLLDSMTEPPNYDWAKTTFNLIKRIRKIGVLQLNFTLFGNKESSGEIISNGNQKEYLPCDLPFEYDNRFFRTGYACKNEDIKFSRFKGSLQSEAQTDDLIRLAYEDKKPVVCYRGRCVEELYKKQREKSKQ